ncbi:alcohol dehydrogenase catalytic domain-containing protein [Streptomyces hygroscopicus]|uniref:alcohol dehydrogenase catalytic domain-containing protein n=1 Tax=Streptomyces hygroscopicus TaxID=1912 RepID=UPI0007DB5779|nr:alcohol dehydrogenase catalytic domain-containing protein [Streptomyces sp. NBRC 109436]
MKAIIYRDNGAPDVRQFVDRDLPAPGPGEVRVRVAVSGVNPTDWQARSGAGHPQHLPQVTPHLDGAGTIDAVGEGVVEPNVLQNIVLNTRVQFLVLYTAGPEARTAAVQDVAAAVRDGALPAGEKHGLPLIRFPLDRTADAHRAVESHAVGKAQLDVTP